MNSLKKDINLSFVQFSPKFGDVEYNLKTACNLIYKAEPGIIVLPELINSLHNFKNLPFKVLDRNSVTLTFINFPIKFSPQ